MPQASKIPEDDSSLPPLTHTHTKKQHYTNTAPLSFFLHRKQALIVLPSLKKTLFSSCFVNQQSLYSCAGKQSSVGT